MHSLFQTLVDLGHPAIQPGAEKDVIATSSQTTLKS